MSKTLKQFLEVYKPKSPDEQKFVDKHVTIKHKDRDGNGDDVFTASNIKTAKRKEERHGYDSGEDEKVYEAVHAYDKQGKLVGRYKDLETAKQLKPGHKYVKEEAEDLDEAHAMWKVDFPKQHVGKPVAAGSAHVKAQNTAHAHKVMAKRLGVNPGLFKSKVTKSSVLPEEVEELDESVAKVANHLIKRYGENVRKSHVRSAANDFGVGFVALSHHVRKKLGVNRLDEEQLDELSLKTLDNYRTKARREIIDADANDDNVHYNKRVKGYRAASKAAGKKFAKEEVEDLEENILSEDDGTGTYSWNKKHKKHDELVKAGFDHQAFKHKDGVMHTYWSKGYRNGDLHKVLGEEAEQIDELSTATLQSYRKKARAQGNAIVDKMKLGGGDWSKDQKDTKTLRKRAAGAQASGKQLVKRGESLKTEEAIDEVAPPGAKYERMVKHVKKGYAKGGLSDRERAIAYATAWKAKKANEGVEYVVPTLEDQLIERISDLSESNQETMFQVFEQLSEDNKARFVEYCETPEGVNAMLDFAIDNRGE